MAEIVGEALLSGLIDAVLKRYLSHETANLILGKKLNQELLVRLETALLAAEALVDDAEKKQFHDTRVKKWLYRLKDAVYDADDLLDLVYTKAATQNKEVSNILNRFLNDFKDSKMVTQMVTKMEEIVRRIEALEKCKDTFGLKKTSKEKLSRRPPTTSLVKGEIYGRENDKDAMIKLLKDENSDANISVIPIVGMGGVGKTTLAQWMYNNKDLMKEFDLKAWVCVSEDFNIVKITQIIIEEVTGRSCDTENLNLLQLDLKDKLTGKKFFIVLDDVWNEAYGDWNDLKTPFQHGIRGSKILVTTRSKKVVSVVQTCLPYEVNVLSNEYCWFVFANHACFSESNENPALEEVGREIVKKCRGLPLAAQTLGGLLRVKHDVKEWDTILKTEIWNFSVEDSEIIPALWISYYHLPPHSKRCFVYCSLYPKDYKFRKDELILLWMAEDLLPPPENGKTLEEVGYDCFDDLASRLFFQQINTYYETFVMHDLMHDLATSIAGEFFVRSEELGNAHEMSKMSMMTRYLSYQRLSHPISKNSIGRVKSTRTLLPIIYSNFINKSSTSMILSEFKCLRVLSFGYFYSLDVLPDSIGELIHLRYLDLTQTRIETLPKSIGNLYNLQTLKLGNCYALTMLPNSMQNLVNLRHLDIKGTNLKKMPRGMSKLKKLQVLDYFVVGKHEEENGMMELGELSNINGSLSIRKLENVGCSSEASKARIMDKTHIETLEFKWSAGDDDMVTSISSEIERDILDKLQPHKGLQRLIIDRYRGTIFPDWVGHSSYHGMTKITLKSCSNCCMLPSLGQLPSLKFLFIGDCSMLRSIGEEFYKSDDDHSSLAAPFPSLESLSFRGMSCLEKWHSSQSDAFPQLKILTISNCPKLTGDLPVQHSTLQTLEIGKCDKLVASMFEGISITHLTCLESLYIYELKSLPCHMNTLLPKLETLVIRNCPEIELFPDGGLPPNLKSLRIKNCSKLKSLPCDMNTLLPKLETLKIRDCEKLLSGQSSMGVLENLTYLEIWGRCESVKCFPKEGLLPHLPSLTELWLGGFSSLETLDCKELLHLTPSLQQLQITSCPKLEKLIGDGLPDSLTELRISHCPLLEERCKMKDPQIWTKIPHICEVRIMNRKLDLLAT